MTKTTLIGTLVTAVILAVTGFGQAVNPAKVKVNGVIGLDSTYSQALKALGRPRVDGKATPEECIGGREKTVKYDGLELYFMDGDSKGGKTFEVKSFVVTSRRWRVSGLSVGDTAATVRAKFGRKYTSEKDPEARGDSVWSYEMPETDGPGTTTVVFRKGKVIEIATSYQVC